MAKNGYPFCKTALILPASLLAPTQIWLPSNIFSSDYDEDKFPIKSHLKAHFVAQAAMPTPRTMACSLYRFPRCP